MESLKLKVESKAEFDFENLTVYQKALDFADAIFDFCDKLPGRLQSSLGNQLRKASLSVCNNIAEGSDKAFPKEKVLFYSHALHSMRECVPGLTLAQRRGLLSMEEANKFRPECLTVCRMLKRLIQSVGISR